MIAWYQPERKEAVLALVRQFPEMFDEDEIVIMTRQLDFPWGDGSDRQLVLVEGEALIGFASTRPSPERPGSWELQWLVVDPAHHRSGIGRQLVERAEALAKAAGADGLLIMTLGSVHPDSHRAQAFYASLGYRELDRQPNFWGQGEDKLYLFKPLRVVWTARLRSLLTGEGDGDNFQFSLSA